MFFLDSSPTPLDLRFQILGFPVRVTPWFWIVMALFGSWTLDNRAIGPIAIVLWVACAFVSILVHELGHAVAAWRFRCPSRIVLIAFGGYAEYTVQVPPTGWRRLVVSLAGPAAGFLLCGLVYISDKSTGWSEVHNILGLVYLFLMIQTIVWNLFNLLPIFPLDGGQSLQQILYICGVRKPERPTYTVSTIVAGAIAAAGLLKLLRQDQGILDWLPYVPGPFMIFWFGLMAVENYQRAQQASRTMSWDEPDDDYQPWARRR